MPVRWALHDDILVFTFEGDYAFAEIADAARAGLGSVAGRVRVIVDATAAARLPDAKGVRQRIALLGEVRGRLAGPVAIVASEGAMFGVARQIAARADLEEGVRIRVFTALEDARTWMLKGCPAEE